MNILRLRRRFDSDLPLNLYCGRSRAMEYGRTGTKKGVRQRSAVGLVLHGHSRALEYGRMNEYV